MSIPSRGANREPNETYTKKGVLKKITYPVGGTTDFLFELNTYKKFNQTTPLLCGGLRIKKVTVNEGTQSRETFYDYTGDDNAASSGSLVVPMPIYEFTQTASSRIGTANLDLKTETSLIPLSDWSGYHVQYNKVTEIKPGGGKTIYRYETELWSQYNNNCIYGNGQYPFKGAPIYLETDKIKSTTSIANDGLTVVSSTTLTNRLVAMGTVVSSNMATCRVANYTGFYTDPEGTTFQYWAQFKNTIIDEFNSKGLPTKQRGVGGSLSIAYDWDVQKRLKSKTVGVTNQLTTFIEYIGNTALAGKITDENGLIKKFIYDKLSRLETIKDRMQADGSDVQATMAYTYQYKNATNPYNFLGTLVTFKGVTTPLSTKQYMDGLGRPIEVVKEGYTPDGLHQKNYMTYDALGRPFKTYLPFESGALGFDINPLSCPYVKAEYEASPLSRPIKQTNVDGTTVLSGYGTNNATDVRIITNYSDPNATNLNFYAANLLYKTTMTDENAKETTVFKDKLGRVLLTRKLLSGQKVETYNIYDDYGQLVAVLPPGSVNGNGGVTQVLIYTYTYDNQNRLIEKKVPGAAPQKFYYNAIDQLRLTQDGNMAIQGKYLGTQYDDLNRVVKTGLIAAATVGNPTNFVNQGFNIADDENKLTETQYYTNKSWVKNQGAKVLKSTGVSTLREFIWSYVERRDGYTYTGNPMWAGKQHLLSKTYRYGWEEHGDEPINDNDYGGVDWSVSAYDGAQKPILTNRNLYSNNGIQNVRTAMTFDYDNGQRLKNMNYGYGVSGAGPSTPVNLTNLNYNFKDQLIEKNIALNGTNALQSIDYSYNLRGWLTAINNISVYGNGTTNAIYTPNSTGLGAIQELAISPLVSQAMLDLVAPYRGANAMELPPINDNNADLFSEKIDYDNPDTRAGAPPQYNGNISAVTWLVAGRDKQAYGFKYDDLDRLIEANYFDLTDSYSNGQWVSSFSTDNKFMEKQTYDVRGNITSLQRKGLNGGSWTSNGYVAATYGMIDNLSYSYDPISSGQVNQNNQLLRVTDVSLGDKGFKFVNNRANANDVDYQYDANGNLIYDRHKGITEIKYNYLNLPILIRIQSPTNQYIGGTIEFVYDATGVKLRKIVTGSMLNNGGQATTYDYINGVEYKNGELQRIAHTEGSVVRNENGAYQQEYVLRDHLGNTRVTFRDGVNLGDPYFDWNTWTYVNPNANNATYNVGVVSSSDICQINHFYPFGANMEGNWSSQGCSAGGNKYQYNGKEWNDDFGLGWNDYGARMYDATMARWTTKDPLSEKYANWSPYNYTLCNPIKNIDPNGMDVKFLSADGSYTATGQDAINVFKGYQRAAKKYGWGEQKNTRFIPRIAIHLVLKSKTKEIYQHTVDAIPEHGFFFTYDPNKKNQEKRRTKACAGHINNDPTKSLDEYPFASVKEGGAGASVRAVDDKEQLIQGGFMRGTTALLEEDDRILVIPFDDINGKVPIVVPVNVSKFVKEIYKTAVEFIESMSGRASPILQRVITMPIIIPCVTCMGYEKNNLNQSIPSDN